MSQSVEPEVTCQVCGKVWPEDQAICPDDGTWLNDQTIMEIKPRAKRVSRAEFDAVNVPDVTAKQFGSVLKKPAKPATVNPARLTPSAVMAAVGEPPPKLAELEPGAQIGEYAVEAKIGEGAMGTVYRAVHPQIGKRVAIKLMTPKLFDEPESVKRFVAEARAVAAIEHPGIVDVFGFGRIPDGRTYLVMEWLDGESLGDRLKRGPLPWLDACEILRQICRALEAAHAKGIVHRDLKPENVFLQKVDDEDQPVVKLLDFGLAKTTNKEDAFVAKTKTGQLLGTPLYMSPEQCKSKGVDHRTDIYALGCLCYELLLGRTPFDADNVAELISAHLVATPPRPSTLQPDIPPELDRLLFNTLAKDADKRPPLGEIRRLIGMQLSRPSQPVLALAMPPHTFATAETQPSLPQAPRASESLIGTDAEILAAIKRPPWIIYAALGIAVVIVVAAVMALG